MNKCCDINKNMQLYEMLDITIEDCLLITPFVYEQERIKKLEMQKHKTLKHYEIAMRYEYALVGLLHQDKIEIIKSLNRFESILVDVDILCFHYNSIAQVLASYFRDKQLLSYRIEMYKLFEFYREPFHIWIKKLNANMIKEGLEKNLFDKDLLKNIRLFPQFGMLLEAELENVRGDQLITATKAQLNLWKNE